MGERAEELEKQYQTKLAEYKAGKFTFSLTRATWYWANVVHAHDSMKKLYLQFVASGGY